MEEHHEEKERRVRVYELVNPEAIRVWYSQIKELFGIVVGQNANDPKFVFHINATSGWMYFEASGRIRAEKPRLALPPNQLEAQKIADNFLSKLALSFQEVKKYPFLKNLEGYEMVPRNARAIDAVAVASSHGNFPEHWLVRYEISLPGFENGHEKCIVKGSQIEIRVGDRGEIVGYNARWRPILKKVILTPFIPLIESHHEHAEEAESESSIQQIYWLFGDDIPQYSISLYHFQPIGHHIQLHSACKFSLEVRFKENHTIDEMEITAIVNGGSGVYSYGWGYYTLESFWEKGVVEPGVDQPTIKISPPIYAMVMCHVFDVQTRAYFYHKQQVIGAPQMLKANSTQQFT